MCDWSKRPSRVPWDSSRSGWAVSWSLIGGPKAGFEISFPRQRRFLPSFLMTPLSPFEGRYRAGLGIWLSVVWAGALSAGPIPVPNASFESPVTPFVNTHVDDWQKVPKPDWYIENGGYTWDQLAGVFLNTPIGASDHIINCDGKQALYLFAVPQV